MSTRPIPASVVLSLTASLALFVGAGLTVSASALAAPVRGHVSRVAPAIPRVNLGDVARPHTAKMRTARDIRPMSTGTVRTVCRQRAEYQSIQAAVNASNAGDTILVCAACLSRTSR